MQFLNLRGQSAGEFFAALPLLLRQIQLAAQINRILFQFPNFFPAILEKCLRGWELHTGQPLLRLRIELRQNVGLRNGRQIPLQQLLSILTEFFNEVQGIEDREKHIPFTEHLVEIRLPNGVAVVGDAHAILLPAAGQLMRLSGFIRKAHRDLQVRVRLVVQTVNAALAEKGKSRDGKRNRVCQTGFAAAVAAGDDGGIAERYLHRRFIAFEARNGHADDLKAFDLFHFAY